MTAAIATALRWYWPAEWAPHASLWVAYPCDAALWGADLAAAQQECLALCNALAQHDDVVLWVATATQQRQLQQSVTTTHLRVMLQPYGDIWLRDTAPIFLRDAAGVQVAGCFRFNGWGQRFVYADDSALNLHLANAWVQQKTPGQPKAVQPFDWVLEGGSVETDGCGTLLTTKQCLQSASRNPHLSPLQLAAALTRCLGVQRIIWLASGLQNDHTDGHIDTLARFVAPGHVVCMTPRGSSDVNAAALQEILATLRCQSDARGQHLQVHTLSSPGTLCNSAGALLPASYLNFIISNSCVVVPTYGVATDAAAVAQIAALFPRHRTVGLSALAILSGGGAFHCMSQQVPQ